MRESVPVKLLLWVHNYLMTANLWLLWFKLCVSATIVVLLVFGTSMLGLVVSITGALTVTTPA